ncbi:MAG: UDP-N-acetylmuramoyl-L-alanine--D-glutamate ligase [Nitrospirae bacterium]|nr:UDP-N-acetylmuramoyl-L-alanine--D-glutamate ligase [Nitrospirota bacterium]
MPPELRGKRVTVVGLGRSGQAATRLLVRQGAKVTVTDHRPAVDLDGPMALLRDYPVRYCVGGHPEEAFQDAELIVMSPGIAVESVDAIEAAKTRGVPVIGELELAFRFAKAPVAAITGTNGKSTTTALIGGILRQSGRRVFVGGNLGRPLCEAVLEPVEWDWLVAEVSSFQLETIGTFRPRVAVLLNVTPNHLDRYRTMEDYLSAKLRLFENQTEDDTAVVNADDPTVLRETGSVRARRIIFSQRSRPETGVYAEAGAVVATGISASSERMEIIRREELPLPGSHNLENVLAAAAVGLVCGCPPDQIRKAVREFKGLEHRLEPVRKRNGVLYVNDSKATTVVALAKALEAFSEQIVLIAGGRNKGATFDPLRDLVSRRVKTAVLIGEARPILRAAWNGAVHLVDAESLEEAVRLAAQTAASGDVVLLAPACASYDMFRDFEDRGRRFKEIVNGL